ncbi:MAG: M23 family metallopeptidase, partial [Elusimicrobia bacterium]|nr:M23 family metallopeptidase [Elusimicrobiota bacterium]
MKVLALAVLLGTPALGAAPDPRLTIETRALKPGEIVLVTVEGNDPKVSPQAAFRGQDLQFFPAASSGTWIAFMGIDLESSTGPARLLAVMRAPGGKPVHKEDLLTVEPSSFSIVELHVEQKFVTPAKSDSERAEGEASRLHRLFAKGEEKRLFEGRFESPIPGAPTARFGERRIFNGQPRAPHSGMDLRAKLGVPVKAPAAGRVVLADPLFYQGKTIVLDHGLGLTTLYAHLSKILVRPGELVKRGQVIGTVGATGRVTGPHLHWALKVKTSRVDPYSLVYLDLDAKLKPRADSPLKRSALCGSTGLPPEPKWGKTSGGLRARARPAKALYSPGENVSLLVEIQNIGTKAAFVDFVRDASLRPLVLGVGEGPRPYDALASSRTASGPLTEQIKIPRWAVLCFEQSMNADGPLLARETTSYALSYGTDFL